MNISMPEYGGLFEWIGEGGVVQNLYLFDCDYTETSAALTIAVVVIVRRKTRVSKDEDK